MAEALIWPLALGLIGAVLGSFIATVAVRWPASAMTGRSRCDGCGRTLRWWDVVPLLSWMAVRGRCRTCGGRIAIAHPMIEALGLAIGVGAGCVAPGAAGAAGAVLGWLLLAAAAIDAVAYRLPNPLTAAIAVGGLTGGLFGVPPDLFERAWGGIAGFGTLWLVAALYRAVRGRDGLGGGDAKLLGAIGLWLGWRALPGVILIACAAGLAIAVARRMRRDDRLPFGTLLAIGAAALWVLQNRGAG